MNAIRRRIMPLRKDNKIEGGGNMESNTAIKREIDQGCGIVLPTRKINPMENKNIEYKKMQELQNKIIGTKNNIASTNGFAHDTRKRQFIKKGILGLIAGIGIVIFSKIANARLFFSDATSQSTAAAAQATQAALEAETNEDTYPPPDLIKHSPGVSKAWCTIAAAGTDDGADYNLSSITDTAAGDRTINLTTAMSGNRPAGAHGWARGGGSGANHTAVIPETMTGGNTLKVRTRDNDTLTDISHMCVIMEDI